MSQYKGDFSRLHPFSGFDPVSPLKKGEDTTSTIFCYFCQFLRKVINVPLKTHHDEQKQFTIGHMIDSVMIKECNPTPPSPKKTHLD